MEKAIHHLNQASPRVLNLSIEPVYQKDTKTLEKVQGRVPKVQHLLRQQLGGETESQPNYIEIKKREGLGLIQLYKIESGINQVDWVNQTERLPKKR